MGRPMAKRLVAGGYKVTIWNRTPSKTAEVAQAGAKVGTSPKDVASRSDVTVIMMADTPDVRDVAYGAHGVLDGVRRGAVVVDMSTISPGATREIAAALEQRDGKKGQSGTLPPN